MTSNKTYSLTMIQTQILNNVKAECIKPYKKYIGLNKNFREDLNMTSLDITEISCTTIEQLQNSGDLTDTQKSQLEEIKLNHIDTINDLSNAFYNILKQNQR